MRRVPRRPARTPSTFVAFVEGTLGVQLTSAQRVLALVAFDGVQPSALRGRERELARELFGDVDEVPESARSVLAALCGARSGKSYVLVALYSLWRAVVADLGTLAPGEHASALIVAPDLRLARQALRFALGAARGAPSVAPMVQAVTRDAFTIARRDGRSVRVECLPAARGGAATRGRSLVSACLDEACFFRDENFAICDTDVFASASPRVLPGGMTVLCSTAWSEAGVLWSLVSSELAAPVTALACVARTEIMRADGAGSAAILRMVQRERVRDEGNARREYDAEPLGTQGGTFFTSDELQLARDPDVELGTLPADHTVRAVCGIDPALVHDAAAAVVLHVGRDGTLTVAEIAELVPQPKQPLALDFVVAAFAEVALMQGCGMLTSDVHMLSEVSRHAREHGLRVTAVPGGGKGKQRLYQHVRDLLRSGRLRLPERGAEKLIAQLADVRAAATSGGQLSITSPRRNGSHGDLVSALAHACWQARQTGADTIARALVKHSRGEKGEKQRSPAQVQRIEMRAARKAGAVLDAGSGVTLYGTPGGVKIVRREPGDDPWSRMATRMRDSARQRQQKGAQERTTRLTRYGGDDPGRDAANMIFGTAGAGRRR